MVRALHTYDAHTGVVEDVAWHGRHPDIFASVGDDKNLMLWDLREKSPRKQTKAHAAEVNCVQFNPREEHLLATGSADRTVVLHDMRYLEQRLHFMEAHKEEVFQARRPACSPRCGAPARARGPDTEKARVQIGWCPDNPTVLASCGADRRLNVWALHKIGDAQTAEEAEDGPPELLFVHGGHTSKISDFAWNPCAEFMLASVAEDNILQLWQPAEEIYTRDENIAADNGAP